VAVFALTIPDDQVDRVVAALCAVGGYDGDPDNRKARREFAREVVIRYVRATVMQVERNQAVADAMTTVTVEPVPID
jgi:hypothetical protein